MLLINCSILVNIHYVLIETRLMHGDFIIKGIAVKSEIVYEAQPSNACRA